VLADGGGHATAIPDAPREIGEDIIDEQVRAAAARDVHRGCAGYRAADEGIVSQENFVIGQQPYGRAAIVKRDDIAGEQGVEYAAGGTGIDAQTAGGVGGVGDEQAAVHEEFALYKQSST